MQRTSATLLILSLLVVGGLAAPRRLLVVDNEAAAEHQRILAELEEVHQLRERMLQEGKGVLSKSLSPQPQEKHTDA